MRVSPCFFPLLLFLTLGGSTRTLAHGAKLTYQSTQAIEIQATYDDGSPMANAQVVIYAPDDPTTPWLTGMTNPQGQFIFTPDGSQSGNWDIKVRQAGHGDILTIPLTQDTLVSANVSSSQSNYTPLQKALMAITGIWGFVGTALFFSRKKVQS